MSCVILTLLKAIQFSQIRFLDAKEISNRLNMNRDDRIIDRVFVSECYHVS